LLRLFQSEYFDAHLHMHYLLRMEQSGVQDYLVNELYKMTDDDIDFYLPQLTQIALLRYNKSSLHRFLLDKAAQSMPFALKIHWLVQSIVEDKSPELYEYACWMLNLCEAASVNSSASSRAKENSDDPTDPPTPERKLRSSSDPDLQSHVPSRNLTDLTGGAEEASSRDNHRRSRTPGAAMKSRPPRDPDAPPSAPPTPSGEGGHLKGDLLAAAEELDKARFQPPPRGRSESVESALEESDAASGQEQEGIAVADPTTLSEAEALRAAALRHLFALDCSSTPDERAQALGWQSFLPNALVDLGGPVSCSKLSDGDHEDVAEAAKFREVIMKQRRCDYFNAQNQLVSLIMRLSAILAALQEKQERIAALGSTFNLINRWLFDRRLSMAISGEGPLFLLGLHIPLWRNRDSLHQILHIHVEHCRIFSSATRAPFLLMYESASLDEGEGIQKGDAGGPTHQSLLHQPATAALPQPSWDMFVRCAMQELQRSLRLVEGSEDAEAGEEKPSSSQGSEDDHAKLHRLVKMVTPEQWNALESKAVPSSPRTPSSSSKTAAEDAERKEEPGKEAEGSLSGPKALVRAEARKRRELAEQTRELIWGESWKDKRERIRRKSPYRHFSSWALNSVMVKGGDDLRQELLASQIIEQFSAIFQEAGLPLWLKATKVLVTSSTAGFLEFIHDSISVDSMKRLFPGKSLAEIFKVAFADKPFEAKKNFIESSAAYSLVIYFLQVKDRHNGNLMLLTSGHVVHIDFGFMLSNSPGGNMGFENSPFKLTQEFLDVMDGECSEQYEYFRTLLIRGFLEARKHMERIILQVRMMLTGSKMPCFREGTDFVLQTLQDRFFANLTEEACIEKVVDLIDTSVNNWRTIQYDNYQRMVNGIL